METFPVEYFTYATSYPESGSRIQLGGSYQYDVLPEAPDQRIFRLNLQGMTYFLDDQGVLDAEVKPGRNMALLEEFYNTHKRAKEFIFNHPIYGAVVCKFNTPLTVPEGIINAGGVLRNFQVELIEQP